MDSLPPHDSPPRIGCRYRKCNASFSRKTDARRHERQVHQPAKVFCSIEGCRFRGTVRTEVMRKHLKSKHPFVVEKTFHLNSNHIEDSSPKLNISLDPSSPTHKIDSFLSWNAVLPPKAFSTNKTDESEHVPETHMNMGYSGLSHRLTSLQETALDLHHISMFQYTAYNQEILDHANVVERHVAGNMASWNTPGWNEDSVSEEQYFRWLQGPWGSKEYLLEGWKGWNDNPTSCGGTP